MTNEEYVRERENGLLASFEKILQSDFGILDLVINIYSILSEFDLHNKEEFSIFLLVESESDHLPKAKTRHLWDSNVLTEKDEEIKNMEMHYHAEIVLGCEKLKSFLLTYDLPLKK